MSGKLYLADTNAFIYLLQKHPALSTLLNSDWYYSFITEIELLGKKGIRTDEILKVKEMLSIATKIIHNESISERAISLRQRYTIKTPDAIIAATAWHHRLPLITADAAFSKIKEIDIFLVDVS